MPESHSNPARNAFVVTPSDVADLPQATRGIMVGTAGNLNVTMIDGTTLVIIGLAAGIIHPICAKRIWSSSTTAGSITAFF